MQQIRDVTQATAGVSFRRSNSNITVVSCLIHWPCSAEIALSRSALFNQYAVFSGWYRGHQIIYQGSFGSDQLRSNLRYVL